MYQRDLAGDLCCGYTENIGNLSGNLSGAGSAKAGVRLDLFGKSLSVTVASCVTARTTVCTG